MQFFVLASKQDILPHQIDDFIDQVNQGMFRGNEIFRGIIVAGALELHIDSDTGFGVSWTQELRDALNREAGGEIKSIIHTDVIGTKRGDPSTDFFRVVHRLVQTFDAYLLDDQLDIVTAIIAYIPADRVIRWSDLP